jgi:hypothetical protein
MPVLGLNGATIVGWMASLGSRVAVMAVARLIPLLSSSVSCSQGTRNRHGPRDGHRVRNQRLGLVIRRRRCLTGLSTVAKGIASPTPQEARCTRYASVAQPALNESHGRAARRIRPRRVHPHPANVNSARLERRVALHMCEPNHASGIPPDPDHGAASVELARAAAAPAGRV